jgi:hypothetical protein
MKKLSILLVFIPFLYSFQIQAPRLDRTSSPFQQSINLEHLCQTWYAKQMLIDGEESIDFPTNNDELTLNKDRTFKTVDNLYDEVDTGNWEIVSGDNLKLSSADETFIFKIKKLTDSELELELDMEGETLLIKQSNVK